MFRTSTIVVAACFSVFCSDVCFGQDDDKAKENRVEVHYDDKKKETHIRIKSDDGTYTWNSVAETIIKYASSETDLIEFPDDKTSGKVIDLNSWKSRLGLRVADVALGDGIDFNIKDKRRVLHIRIQHEFLGERMDAFKKRLRAVVLGEDDAWKENYKIKFPKDGSFSKPKVALKANELCLFIHGLNSSSAVMRPLAEKVHALGYPIAFFDYPNDDKIRNSAILLSNELKKLKEKNSKLKVTIIAHSMGGLVTRKTIEYEHFDPQNVKSVCLICTPSHGSNLANYAFGIDLIEHFFTKKDAVENLSRFKSSFADGLNGAARDLKPESSFLETLNKLPRNENVKYCLFIGTNGVVPKPTQAGLSAANAAVKPSLVQKILAIPKRKLNEYEEVIDGKGDGVVSVKSATLEGVAAIHKFKVSHSSMWTDPEDAESRKLFDAVLDQLK